MHGNSLGAYQAVLAANAVIVPVSPMCRRAELQYTVRDSGTKAILFGAELGDGVAAGHAACGHPGLLAARYRDYAGKGWGFPTDFADPPATPGTTRAEAPEADLPAPDNDRRPEDWRMIPYSSGTTGQPKGCLYIHANVNAEIQAYPLWVGVGPGSRILASLPLCHVAVMQHSMNLPIATQSTSCLVTRWNSSLAARIIEAERIEHWRSITIMMIDFCGFPGIEEADLSSLKAIGGGTQMPAGVSQKMADPIGPNCVEVYGLSETVASAQSTRFRRRRGNASASRSSTWTASLSTRRRWRSWDRMSPAKLSAKGSRCSRATGSARKTQRPPS